MTSRLDRALAGGARIYVVGSSHVAAIEEAWAPETDPLIAFFSFWYLKQLNMSFRQTFNGLLDGRPPPDCVFITFGGNQHNIFGLAHYDPPLVLGDAVRGRIPGGTTADGCFVPRDVMQAALQKRSEIWLGWMRILHDMFPSTRFAHLVAPPPLRDMPVVEDRSGLSPGQQLMMAQVDDGVVDAEARAAIYRIQQEVTLRQAKAMGAALIGVPPEAITPDGFLLPRYGAHADPTHANGAYGRLVLDQILAFCRETA
jgi:hypothetical protein